MSLFLNVNRELTWVISCATLTRFTFVFGLFAYIVWAGEQLYAHYVQLADGCAVSAFSGLRMFAVSGKNWFLSILVFALSVVPFAIDLVRPCPRYPQLDHQHSLQSFDR